MKDRNPDRGRRRRRAFSCSLCHRTARPMFSRQGRGGRRQRAIAVWPEEPEGQTDAECDNRLRQKEKQEELPEQAPQGECRQTHVFLLDQQLIALAQHRLNPRATICEQRQFAPDAAQMYVDAPVVTLVRASQPLLGQDVLADN